MLDCRDYTEKREKLVVNSGEEGGRVGRVLVLGKRHLLQRE